MLVLCYVFSCKYSARSDLEYTLIKNNQFLTGTFKSNYSKKKIYCGVPDPSCVYIMYLNFAWFTCFIDVLGRNCPPYGLKD